MKKILYLLLLFTGIAFSNPIIQTPPDLTTCANDETGLASFNLTINNATIVGSLDSSLHNVIYYQTLVDADNNNNPILDPSGFTSFGQTIYVRVEEIANTSSYSTTSFQLIVNLLPNVGEPNDLYVEDIPFDGIANFDLTLNTPLIINGQTGLTLNYFLSQFGAEANVAPLPVPASFTGTNGQLIWTRVESLTTGCFVLKSFYLYVTNPDIVFISDANFKAKLLEADVTNIIAQNDNGPIKVDINNDGEIQVSEALNVVYLYVFESQIQSLEGVNSFVNLKYLRCFNNQLTELDLSGLNNLEELICSINQLPSLNVNNLTNLKYLMCASNQITSLDLSMLTNLEYLGVQNNLLTNLAINNLTNIYDLNINTNQISNIDISNLINLQFFDCRWNSLTSLNLDGLVNIQTFKCSSSQITNLDLSSLINLELLWCFNNQQLSNLLIKNGSVESNLILTDNPNLQFLCVDESQLLSVQNYLNTIGVTTTFASSYCSFTPGGNYNTINGQIQFDADNNGCDVNDGGQPNIRININDGINQGATFTDVNGGYEFFTQAGNHSITPIIENPSFFTFSPTIATITFADNNNNTATQNFCITANGVHPDLEIVIVPFVPARPGFEAIYKIVYLNKGNQVLSQQYGINFFYNQNLMVYTSSTVTPSSIGVGSTSWDYANLQPFESREILVRIAINAPTDANPVNIGDVLTFTSTIMPQNGDENTMDNLFILNQTVVGSYDPNDITCLEGDIVSPTQIGNYLHYNINFENTGTAPAENVVVKIEVNPADFDINSLQLMNTSHPVDARIRGNIVEFIFQNIMLDSGGHGNILLKIRSQPNLVQGDLVAKKANIYFDYNFPIQTNNAETVFQSLNNPIFEQDNTIKIFPNPTNSFVNISGNFNIKTTELFDTQGRLLQTNIINENTTTLNISAKSNGVYFIKVTSEEGIKVEKIIKQ